MPLTQLNIIKIGGKLINDAIELDRVLRAFAAIEGPKILIHGGGRKATEVSESMGLEVVMVEGRRVTDTATLEIAVMVYAGLINKNIVASLQSVGCNAVGLCGADASIMTSHKRQVKSIDYGWVGDIDHVHVDALQKLLSVGFVPVLCPVTHDGRGQLLNTNADTIAAATAGAMSKSYKISLKYCFEYPGVLYDVNQTGQTMTSMSESEFSAMRSEGSIHSGMIPKLSNGFEALRQGASEVSICGIDNLFDLDGATKLSL